MRTKHPLRFLLSSFLALLAFQVQLLQAQDTQGEKPSVTIYYTWLTGPKENREDNKENTVLAAFRGPGEDDPLEVVVFYPDQSLNRSGGIAEASETLKELVYSQFSAKAELGKRTKQQVLDWFRQMLHENRSCGKEESCPAGEKAEVRLSYSSAEFGAEQFDVDKWHKFFNSLEFAEGARVQSFATGASKSYKVVLGSNALLVSEGGESPSSVEEVAVKLLEEVVRGESLRSRTSSSGGSEVCEELFSALAAAADKGSDRSVLRRLILNSTQSRLIVRRGSTAHLDIENNGISEVSILFEDGQSGVPLEVLIPACGSASVPLKGEASAIDDGEVGDSIGREDYDQLRRRFVYVCTGLFLLLALSLSLLLRRLRESSSNEEGPRFRWLSGPVAAVEDQGTEAEAPIVNNCDSWLVQPEDIRDPGGLIEAIMEGRAGWGKNLLCHFGWMIVRKRNLNQLRGRLGEREGRREGRREASLRLAEALNSELRRGGGVFTERRLSQRERERLDKDTSRLLTIRDRSSEDEKQLRWRILQSKLADWVRREEKRTSVDSASTFDAADGSHGTAERPEGVQGPVAMPGGALTDGEAWVARRQFLQVESDLRRLQEQAGVLTRRLHVEGERKNDLIAQLEVSRKRVESLEKDLQEASAQSQRNDHNLRAEIGELRRGKSDLAAKTDRLTADHVKTDEALRAWIISLNELGKNPRVIRSRFREQEELIESILTDLEGEIEADLGQRRGSLGKVVTAEERRRRYRYLRAIRADLAVVVRERPELAAVGGVEREIGQATVALESMAAAEGAALLSGTDLELARLGPQLMAFEAELRQHRHALLQAAVEEGSKCEGDGHRRRYAEFLDWLLDGWRFQSLMHLLRLQQVVSVYCQDAGGAAGDLYERSEPFRRVCQRLVRTLAEAGVEFAPIHFFESSQEGWSFHENVDGVPLLFTNPTLRALAVGRFRQAEQDLSKTVGDVSFWGFRCPEYPSLRGESRGWLCRGWRTL